MFGIGLPELMMILVVALLVVGPRKLPGLAKSLGKGLSEFRRATEEIKNELADNETYKDIKGIQDSIQETVDAVKPQGLLDATPAERKTYATAIDDSKKGEHAKPKVKQAETEPAKEPQESKPVQEAEKADA